MSNMIELNIGIESISSLKPFTSDLSHFVDERLDVPSDLICCQDCGINNTIEPISVNGLCKSCAEIHQMYYNQ